MNQVLKPLFNCRKDSPDSQNIMFDEMSESKKLHQALTNVHLESIMMIILHNLSTAESLFVGNQLVCHILEKN